MEDFLALHMMKTDFRRLQREVVSLRMPSCIQLFKKWRREQNISIVFQKKKPYFC